MRIGIDARLWNETGVGRYIRNLVWELQKIDDNNEYILYSKKGNQGLGIKKKKLEDCRDRGALAFHGRTGKISSNFIPRKFGFDAFYLFLLADFL